MFVSGKLLFSSLVKTETGWGLQIRSCNGFPPAPQLGQGLPCPVQLDSVVSTAQIPKHSFHVLEFKECWKIGDFVYIKKFKFLYPVGPWWTFISSHFRDPEGLPACQTHYPAVLPLPQARMCTSEHQHLPHPNWALDTPWFPQELYRLLMRWHNRGKSPNEFKTVWGFNPHWLCLTVTFPPASEGILKEHQIGSL